MRTYNNLSQIEKPKEFSDIRDLYRSTAEKFGTNVQYVYRENDILREFTYSDFWQNMKQFGTALYARGLDDARIAVIGDTHPRWVIAFTTVMCTGGVAVPLDKELDDSEIVNFLRRAKCSAVVFTGAMNKRIAGMASELSFLKYLIPTHSTDGEDFDGVEVLPFDQLLGEGAAALAAGDTRYEDHEIDMDKMSALLFTSGTTGTSKGVMLSHRNLTAAADASCKSTCYDSRAKFVSVLPIHHTFELTCQHLAQSNLGGKVYINESLRYATRNFKEFKPTTLVLVPLFLETVHKKIWEEIRKKGIEKKVRTGMKLALSLLKTGVDIREKLFSEITAAFGGKLTSIVVGGAPIDPQIIKDFYAFGITVLQGYGITECAPLVAVNRPGRVKFDSVGQVVENCEYKIEAMEGCEEGEGEILVRGQNVMLGYYEDEEATAAVFTEDGFFRTGDIGRIDKQGYLTITGRKKNVIIASNGKNVFPEELEERLLKIPVVKETVVLQRETDGASQIIAIVVPNTEVVGEDYSSEDVCTTLKEEIAKINKGLPSYKHIDKFEIRREDFEKTPTKKIKRFLLK